MGNESHRNDFSAVDRRIDFLRAEIYAYDKFFSNPQAPGNEVGVQMKFAIDAQRNQEELEQLMYLRSLATVANKPTGIKAWQALILVFYSTMALAIAGLSLWLVSASH